MGRRPSSRNSSFDLRIDPRQLADMVAALGRRQLGLIFTRYRYLLLVGGLLVFIWISLSPRKSRVLLEEEGEAFLPPPALPLKSDLKAAVALKKSTTSSSSEKSVKETARKFLSKHKTDDKRNKLLFPPADFQEMPDRDFDPGQQNKKVPTDGKSDESGRSRVNSINGVVIPNHSPDDSVVWSAVGGADIYRGQAAPATAGVHGHDEFFADFAKQVAGLGEGGEPVVLEGREKALGDEIMKTEAFNLVVSDKISYTRAVPDTRDVRCQAIHYDTNLPTTSVVIIFTNEAWSPLIRTIYSVLNRSPAQYLHEIILVDDFSDKKHLKHKLERFIQKYFPPKVKLMRLKKREGLIRARLEGAKAATGDVILFLDSHCECNTGWLEPLLQRIKENPLAFVVPIIDVIDDKTMEYYHGNGNYFQVGGFTWSGHFTWIDISLQEISRRGSPVAPTRTPTMAGGLFAVARSTFWELGSYDEEMDVWGGENLEMSFRIWQCGGVLETIPCSRVGHIFRSFHPYSFPGNKDTHGINTARTVEVWLDDYKRLFYMHRPDLLNIQIGSLEARNRFKAQKQCRPFQWFLDNIYPEKFILDSPEHVYAYGRLRNPTSATCLDNLQSDDKDTYDLGQYACHSFMASAQFFSFSRKFELRREDSCAQVTAPFPQREEKVVMAACLGQGGAQEWAHTKDGRIIHKETRKCLDAGRGNSMDVLYVAPCQAVPTQVWFFDHYVD